ncbi:LpxL/LpxP family acyltransferase [Sphingobacterium luzhongxinii]|uniref:LpxL/LpxP family acyltransferase n=2 Tax=Sphingobacterium TaxID=28453 RepID=UPI0013DC974C|nr:hypothetical protein [Sphingobacterium sp. xlx-183]
MAMRISDTGRGKLSHPVYAAPDWNDVEALNTYALLSANLSNFMPQLQSHQEFFQRYRYQQVLNGNDLLHFERDYPSPVEGWDAVLALVKAHRGIIATYHFGPFQLINYLLMRAKIPYVLLVAGQVIADWRAKYPQLLARMELAARQGGFQLLDANDPAALRMLYRLLDKGFSLLIYTDGVEGVAHNRAARMTRVNFLGQQIYVPRGTATLAYRFGLPIYPCLLWREGDRIRVEAADTITVAEGLDPQQYARMVADQLFALLAKYVMHWPEQWTNWSVLHRFLLHKPPIGVAAGTVADMERHYGLVRVDNNPYLLEKRNYKMFPLDEVGFKLLKNSWF